MSPDDIQGPRHFFAQSASPPLSAVSIGASTAHEPPSSSSTGDVGQSSSSPIQWGHETSVSSLADGIQSRVVHSTDFPGVASPRLRCSSLGSPDKPSTPEMPEHLVLGRATPEQLEETSSHGTHIFKAPSPPQTRRRYANLISPGREAVKQASRFGTQKRNESIFHCPDLDELEEWTNATVSQAVTGKPLFHKPPTSSAAEREAVRYNLRTLLEAVKKQSTTARTKNEGPRSVFVRYVPRSVQSERMIESIFGPGSGGSESKSESISRASPDIDTNAENLGVHPSTFLSRLHPLSRNTPIARTARTKPLSDNKTEKSSVAQQPQVNGSYRTPPPLLPVTEAPVKQPTFRIDPSNPLHQQYDSSSIITPKAKPLQPLAPIIPSSEGVTRPTKSLSDPSFNPTFPLSLSPALHRSVLSVSPFIVNHSRPPTTLWQDEQEQMSVAAQSQHTNHTNSKVGSPVDVFDHSSSAMQQSPEEVLDLVSPLVPHATGSDCVDALVTPKNKRTGFFEAKPSSSSLKNVPIKQARDKQPLLESGTDISHSPDPYVVVNEGLIDLDGSDNRPLDGHSQSIHLPPSLSADRSLSPHAHFPPIFASPVSFPSNSNDSADAPIPSIQYHQLHVKSSMAPALWNEVEPPTLDDGVEPLWNPPTRKLPIVIDQGYLRPRYRNFWSLSIDNAFLEEARLHIVIEKAHPELYTWDGDEIGAEDNVDELEDDKELEESDLEIQDPESGVVFLSQKRRDASSSSSSNPIESPNFDYGSESGVGALAETMRRRGPTIFDESASTRRPTKRRRKSSGPNNLSPSKRRRKGDVESEDEAESRNKRRRKGDIESEDESETQDHKRSSIQSVRGRIRGWTVLLYTFLKGKKKFGQSDLLDIKNALRGINDDAIFIPPTSPLAGHIYTIANLQPSDVPNDDKIGLRALAKTILRFWGPKLTKADIAA